MRKYDMGYKHIMIIAYIFIISIMLSACASTPNPALEKARTEYERAEKTPGILDNAPVLMREAEISLKKAEEADDESEITHLAKMAEIKVGRAVAEAQEAIENKKKESIAKQKQKVLLDTRQKEIEKAQKQAEAKARELEKKAQEAKEAQLKAMKMKQEAELARKEAEARALEVEKLKKQVADLQATQTERGLELTLGDVLFASGKAELMPGAMKHIDKLARFLTEHNTRNLIIEGHTDSTGSDSSNLSLSQHRADSVQTALMRRGIASSRITAIGYGESRPKSDNSTTIGRQQNRRVEIIILNAQ